MLFKKESNPEKRLAASEKSKATLEREMHVLQKNMELLEGVNNILKEKLGNAECEWRYHQDIRVRYERELRKLKAEVEKLRTPPLIIGTFLESMDDNKAIIQSSTGPEFMVSISKDIKKSDLKPGVRVGLTQQNLLIVAIIPSKGYIESTELSKIGYEIMQMITARYSKLQIREDEQNQNTWPW